MTKSDPAEFLLTSIQKSYFMLSRSARAVLDTALRKYRPGRNDLILVGGIAQLNPALRLMTAYRLTIQDVTVDEVTTSYTRWLESVQLSLRHAAHGFVGDIGADVNLSWNGLQHIARPSNTPTRLFASTAACKPISGCD